MVIDFNTRREVRMLGNVPVLNPRNRTEYLGVCKEVLEPEDYRDILCGIMDVEIYESLDPQHKKIVDNYYNGFNE